MQLPRRARDLGIVVGTLPTGPLNAITDVPGIRVGHTTLVEGDDVRTGVTAVVPEQLDVRRALPAGLFVGNGFGKMVGTTQVAELGEIETPVLLTATLSTFRVADALVTWMLCRPGHEDTRSVNPVVAETNDGYLSDIRARPITQQHVLAALDGASAGLPAEGAVGAGTGTVALGFKAGIGTASRVVATATGQVTVGVLVQSNFSGVLQVLGVPVPPASVGVDPDDVSPDPADRGNSCVIVVATDGPFDARQLSRIARRSVFARGRVGADYANGSGDYAIAVSTAEPGAVVPDADLDPVFAATMDAVEEALLSSLLMAETVTGTAATPAGPYRTTASCSGCALTASHRRTAPDMADPDPEWLVEALEQLGPLFPMTERELYAFLTVLGPSHSFRSLALLGGRLTGVDPMRLYNDALMVTTEHNPASEDDIAEMRRRVEATGWRPETFDDD